MPRGGFRAGAGRKRRDLDPKVMAPNASLEEGARAYTGEALGILIVVMRDTKASAATRTAAAIHILDRGWGRPATGAEVVARKEEDTREVSDLDLARWILSVLEDAAEEQDAAEAEAAEQAAKNGSQELVPVR